MAQRAGTPISCGGNTAHSSTGIRWKLRDRTAEQGLEELEAVGPVLRLQHHFEVLGDSAFH